MKYVIYSRKSSEGDDRQAQSLDTQERLLGDYAEKNNLEIVKKIRESKSAKTDGNRPLFLEMLEFIQEGNADAILTVHTDRLARNLIDAGHIIKMVEIGSLKEVRTLTGTYNNHISLLYMGFDFVFASHYSRDLSVKVKAGNESKILKGEYPTNAPLGYKNIPNAIIPDPTKSIFITKAFELYSTGNYSTKTLTKELNELGFTTKKGHKISKSVTHRILSNQEYLGLIVRKGVPYQGNHQPLVSKQLFDCVQEILNNKNKSRRQKHNFLYRDFLSCAMCGCKITADKAKQTYTYYHCTNGKGLCDQHKKYLNEKTVQDLFNEYLQNHQIDEETASLSLEVYKDELMNENKFDVQQEKSLKQELKKIEENSQELLEMRFNKEIDKETFAKGNEKLLARKKEIEKELLGETKENLGTTFELLDTIKVRACNLQEVFNTDDIEVKRDLLNSLLSNCFIADKKIVDLNLKLPFRPILELPKNSDIKEWRRRWDSNPRGSFELRFSEPSQLTTVPRLQVGSLYQPKLGITLRMVKYTSLESWPSGLWRKS
jgi:site-specific DNA recombinase